MSKSIKDLLFGITLKEVKENFHIAYNKLESLEGCPEKIGGYFNCSHNRLTSLEGCPEKTGGYFACDENKLTSLEGCPKEIKRHFYCFNNLGKFTQKDVEKICKVRGNINV